MTTEYCKPWNAGLASDSRAVARKIGKLFDSLDALNGNIVSGGILDDIAIFRDGLKEGLERQGWTVSYQTGQLVASNRCHVFPQGSQGGKKIRAERLNQTEAENKRRRAYQQSQMEKTVEKVMQK